MFEKIELQQSKILIVDDEEKNRKLLKAWLEDEGYECHMATSGESALVLAPVIEPDLILLDIMMPGLDGYHVAAKLKQDMGLKNIPIIMVTALGDKDSVIRGLASGAEEFLTKPIDSNELQIRVRNLLRLKITQDMLQAQNDYLEQRVKDRTRELNLSYLATVEALGNAADYRDDETGAHVRRISHYAHALAKCMGKSDKYCKILYYASPLHDIGKIGTPDNVLFKQGALSDEEWVVMKSHADSGAKILKGLKSPITDMGQDIALSHHERWDGSGYPNGLKGEGIPLAARIMSICDVYDALRSKRPYKEPFNHEKCMQIILEGDGRTSPTHFDPKVRKCFEECANEFDRIFNSHNEPSEV